MPYFAVGAHVRTVSTSAPAKDWTPEALRSRRFPATGTVVKEHNGHGLCYEVKHDDYKDSGYYEPHELLHVPKKVRFPRLRQAWLAIRLAIYDYGHPL